MRSYVSVWTLSARRNGRASLAVTALLCLPGLFVLTLAVRQAQTRRLELQTWPRIEARVDSAVVQPWHVATTQAMYAPRYWLTYEAEGRTHHTRLTGDYGNEWADAAHAVDDARHRGNVALLVDPRAPNNVTLGQGYTVDVFAWPLVVAGAGCLLLFIGAGMATAINPTSTGDTLRASRRAARRDAVLAGAAGSLMLAITLFLLARSVRQRTEWVPATAAIDSADVVQRSSSSAHVGRQLYTPRLWIAYELEGHMYRRPVLTGEAWRADEDAVHREASARSNGPLHILIDASDPYRATIASLSTNTEWFCVLFGSAGLGLLAIARLRWRSSARSS